MTLATMPVVGMFGCGGPLAAQTAAQDLKTAKLRTGRGISRCVI